VRLLLGTTALVTGLAIAPAWGQQANNLNTATGIGIGVSTAKANSDSRATAIGGGNAVSRSAAQGGRGGNSSVTIDGNPANTTQNISGTQTVRNVPSVFSPSLAAAGIETCLGSVSGGGAFVGTGFSFGTTIPDPGCAARLDARTLWSMGLKKAAIARLCLNNDIAASMPEVCATYSPYYRPQPVVLSASASNPEPRGPTPFNQTFNYSGGPIMLVEGKTGLDRLCNDYDVLKQRCRVWAGIVSQPSRVRVGAKSRAASHTSLAEIKVNLPKEVTEGKSQ
jgi:hypothetical protein